MPCLYWKDESSQYITEEKTKKRPITGIYHRPLVILKSSLLPIWFNVSSELRHQLACIAVTVSLLVVIVEADRMAHQQKVNSLSNRTAVSHWTHKTIWYPLPPPLKRPMPSTERVWAESTQDMVQVREKSETYQHPHETPPSSPSVYIIYTTARNGSTLQQWTR